MYGSQTQSMKSKKIRKNSCEEIDVIKLLRKRGFKLQRTENNLATFYNGIHAMYATYDIKNQRVVIEQKIIPADGLLSFLDAHDIRRG